MYIQLVVSLITPDSMFKCTVCSVTCRFNKNLYHHMRKQHNIEPPILGAKILCPLLCVDKFRTLKDLRSHLETVHDQVIEKEEQDFSDYEAFKSWKSRLEIISGYAYTRRTSEKTLRKGDAAKTHFICHRSGIFRSRSTGRRKLKKLGSNKIGSTCPSAMEVSHSLCDGTVHVIFWKSHFGHEADINRTPVPKKIRAKKPDSIKYEVCEVLPDNGIEKKSIKYEVCEVLPDNGIEKNSMNYEVCEVLPNDGVEKNSINYEVCAVLPDSGIENSVNYEICAVYSDDGTEENYINYEVCAVLPAAGIGERMGLDTPKQYIPIHDKPVICYTVEAFLRLPFIKKVVVVAASQNLDLMLQTLSQMCALKDEKLMVTEGWGSRHQSVDSGLKALHACCEILPEIVVIHDGVYPFFSEEIICDVVLAAKEHGAAGVICPLVSTVISIDENGFLDHSLNRNKYRTSEMPQAFNFDIICKAYADCSASDFEYGTDCFHLVDKYCGIKAKLLPGSTDSCKITHRKDIYTAQACVKENQPVGIVNFQSSMDLVPFLKTSLYKKFCSVHSVGKVNNTFNKFPNVIQLWSNESICDIVDSLTVMYSTHYSTELLSVVHIVLDSFDDKLNFCEIQKKAKIISRELRPSKLLFYFILVETCDSSQTFEEVAELATSLLFDSNPYISGNIFFIS